MINFVRLEHFPFKLSRGGFPKASICDSYRLPYGGRHEWEEHYRMI